MTEGFFSLSKIQGCKKTGDLSHCGLCGLYKHCKSPKMPATGKGRKDILFIGEAPGKVEDALNTQMVDDSGKLLRRMLRLFHVNLDLDCIKIDAVMCRPHHSEKPKPHMIEACRVNALKTIREYNPNVIFLLGDVACNSVLPEIWKGDLGSINRWTGHCIPCREFNAWVVPTYHPSHIRNNEDNKVLNRLFKNHLRLGIDKADSKPWKKVPKYEEQVERIFKPSQVAIIIREMIKKGGVVAADYETNCLKPEGEGTEIVSCSVCWRGRRTISYPWQGDAIDATDDLWKSPLQKIAANLKSVSL